jgi:hypothetical protein
MRLVFSKQTGGHRDEQLSGCRTPISPSVFVSRPVTVVSLLCTAALPLSQTWLNQASRRAERWPATVDAPYRLGGMQHSMSMPGNRILGGY